MPLNKGKLNIKSVSLQIAYLYLQHNLKHKTTTMKKLFTKLTGTVLAICFTASLNAQTPGTLTVVYTPTVPSTATFYSGARHLEAAWIESSTGTFIKTKIKIPGTSGITDHITGSTWQTASAGNTTGADVTSGATITSWAQKTFTWNATNTANAVVADGSYNIKIYEVWNHGSTTNQLQTSTIAFTKGTVASTLTPAATNWLKGVSVIWHPAVTTGIDEANSVNPLISVYPNPTEGVFNVDFKNATNIKVLNTLGSIVYEEKIEQLTEGTKSIDLSNFTNGIYFINVSNGTNSSNHKVILSK